jgi:DNA-directed RNA polymerase specialized sigma24 family protein
MRRRSVAEELERAERERMASLSPAERVELALALGERSIADYAAAHGVDRDTARKRTERERQAGRRYSACIEALLE